MNLKTIHRVVFAVSLRVALLCLSAVAVVAFAENATPLVDLSKVDARNASLTHATVTANGDALSVRGVDPQAQASVPFDVPVALRAAIPPGALPRLKVSENHRFLVTAEGRPFFWLGDTAWELFHRLNREEAVHYLSRRAAQGFTVIQAVALAQLDGLDTPNDYGHTPLHNNDPARPNEDYFRHVDWIVTQANALGLYVGLLPTWDSYWHSKKLIFTVENAEGYGRWLGSRYRAAGVVWILGGDARVETEAHRQILEAMARGLAAGDGGAHLRTFHPRGNHRSSSEYFHRSDWLDFNMMQSGHSEQNTNYLAIELDYALSTG